MVQKAQKHQPKEKKQRNFTINYKETGIIILLIGIAIFFSIFLRIQTDYLPMTDTWAEDVYKNQMKGMIAQEVAQEYPHLPDAQRQIYIEEQFKDAWKEQEPHIRKDIDTLSLELKNYMKDDEGKTYLTGIDPYIWYAHAKNYQEHGHMGDERVDGRSSFSLRNGPEPKFESFQFYPWLMAKMHKGVSFFNSDFTLARMLYISPIIFIILTLIPAFFIGRRIGGNLGGFLSAMIIAINAPLLTRTMSGFGDTDGFLVLFPLLIMWTGLEALINKDIRWKIGLSVVTGGLVVLFMKSWGFGWHIGSIFLGVLGIYFLIQVIKERKIVSKKTFKDFALTTQTGRILIVGMSFVIGTILFGSFLIGAGSSEAVSLSNGLEPMKAMIGNPLGAVFTFDAVRVDTIWPNVLTTVAELRTGSWDEIIRSVGGKLMLFIGLLGIIATFFLRTEDDKIELRYAIFLGLWSAVIIVASLMGVRFNALLAGPFAIAFGAFFGVIYKKRKAFIPSEQEEFTKPIMNGISIGLIIIACLLLIAPFNSAYEASKNYMPQMNDGWQENLEFLKENNERGLVTSWWDFGHWFISEGEIRVTFDGGHQGKRIYWVGKLLSSSNQEESDNILRMLNCGSEESYNRLYSYLGNEYESVMLLEEIINDSRSEAYEKLKEQGLDSQEANSVLEKSHCLTEELYNQYVVVSEDMVGKAPVWGHFGNWDFTKAQAVQIVRSNTSPQGAISELQRLGFEEELAKQTYYDITALRRDETANWISLWPQYVTRNSVACSQNSTTIICEVGELVGQERDVRLVLDYIQIPIGQPEEARLVINAYRAGQIVQTDYSRLSQVSIRDETYNTGKEGYAVVVEEVNGQLRGILSQKELANSLFTRLFFFEGKGLEGYEKVHESRTFRGERIITYKKTFEQTW